MLTTGIAQCLLHKPLPHGQARPRVGGCLCTPLLMRPTAGCPAWGFPLLPQGEARSITRMSTARVCEPGTLLSRRALG